MSAPNIPAQYSILKQLQSGSLNLSPWLPTMQHQLLLGYVCIAVGVVFAVILQFAL